VEKIKKLKTIAIIPARGGSKRLPKKNILPLDGIPLLARVIRTLKRSSIFEEIIVSTENEEILDIAKKENVKVHIRPNNLATDSATVVETCIDVLSKNSSKIFCCVYATAALLSVSTLQKSFKKFKYDKKVNVLMGVSKYNFRPEQALKIENDGFAKMLFPKFNIKNLKNYSTTRVSNGTFYWARSEKFVKEKTFYSRKLKTFDVVIKEVSDIDTNDDYEELLSKHKTNTQNK
jgi:pseudaminic acid cytidylyltransferase